MRFIAAWQSDYIHVKNAGYANLGWRDKRWPYLGRLILRAFRDFDI